MSLLRLPVLRGLGIQAIFVTEYLNVFQSTRTLISPQEHQIRTKQWIEMQWKLPYLPNVCPNDFIGYF